MREVWRWLAWNFQAVKEWLKPQLLVDSNKSWPPAKVKELMPVLEMAGEKIVIIVEAPDKNGIGWALSSDGVEKFMIDRDTIFHSGFFLTGQVLLARVTTTNYVVSARSINVNHSF